MIDVIDSLITRRAEKMYGPDGKMLFCESNRSGAFVENE